MARMPGLTRILLPALLAFVALVTSMLLHRRAA